MAEDLISLIQAGKLQVGTTVFHSFRKGGQRDVTATVVPQGLRLHGQVYATPSEAAKALVGRSVNGWEWWHLPDGQLLNTLRSASAAKASQ